MQADFDDRITTPRKRSQVPLIMMTLALIVGSIAGYWYWQKTVTEIPAPNLATSVTATKPVPITNPTAPMTTATIPVLE